MTFQSIEIHVKWEGYAACHNTWEPLTSIYFDVKALIRRYFREKGWELNCKFKFILTLYKTTLAFHFSEDSPWCRLHPLRKKGRPPGPDERGQPRFSQVQFRRSRVQLFLCQCWLGIKTATSAKIANLQRVLRASDRQGAVPWPSRLISLTRKKWTEPIRLPTSPFLPLKLRKVN